VSNSTEAVASVLSELRADPGPYLSLNRARREWSDLIPPRTSLMTLYRWTSVGCKGVILRSVQCGGRRSVSRQAIMEFFAELTVKRGARAAGRAASAGAGRRQQAAAQQLDALGIGRSDSSAA
jgi:hypothetical protein